MLAQEIMKLENENYALKEQLKEDKHNEICSRSKDI